MTVKPVTDKSFARYGRVLEGYDFAPVLDAVRDNTPKPADSVIYVPGSPELESLPVYETLRDNFYGGMPIQIGYCNGSNNKLNCLEYHRDSEINIAADDVILLLAAQQDICGGSLDTSAVEAFLLKKGSAAELYATTLHYAPCNSSGGFRVVVVLPKGTNTDKPAIQIKNDEDKLLRAKNKWLLAHPDSPEAKDGAFIGLTGQNIEL